MRVSQRDDDTGHSPEVQARAILTQAQAEGLTVTPEDIWDENVDSAGRIRPVSGGALLGDRPKLLAAVQAVERGDAVAIVAERFDRLFRDLDVQREVIRRVEVAGGRLVTAAGQISHATAEQELHANINGAVAQYTKRSSMERSFKAVEVAIENGRVPWKDTTPGYDVEDGRLVPNAHAGVVARAFAMRAQGVPIRDIRVFLAAHGIHRSFHGVQHLLRSRVVLGELHFGTHTPNLEAHEPIVDVDTWRRVQRARVTRGRRAKSDRLLARLGVLRCGTCGARMIVGASHEGRYPFYRCPPTGDCPRRMALSAVLVEGLVVEKVRAHAVGVKGRASADRDAREAEAEAVRAQAALDSAIRAFTGLEGEAAALERLAELRRARDDARDRAHELGRRRSALVIDAAADWERLTLGERRAIVRATVARVTVLPGRGAGRVRVELFGE